MSKTYIVMSNRGQVSSDPYKCRPDAQSYADEINADSEGGCFYWVIEVEDKDITRLGLGYEAAAGCY